MPGNPIGPVEIAVIAAIAILGVAVVVPAAMVPVDRVDFVAIAVGRRVARRVVVMAVLVALSGAKVPALVVQVGPVVREANVRHSSRASAPMKHVRRVRSSRPGSRSRFMSRCSPNRRA